MRLGIMQPYFFPYLGHFGLIANVDRWIVFDVTQYTPKTWMNRNRILHPTKGVQYVTMSLANSSIHIRTHEARLLDREASRRELLGKLTQYRRAPYYRRVVALVEEAFGQGTGDSLVRLNVDTLSATCRYLELPFDHAICSELGMDFEPGMGPGDWAPAICSRLGASEYLNPAGGIPLFDTARFQEAGVALYGLEYRGFEYATPGFAFAPHLSILDVMMWNPPEAIARHLREAAVPVRAG